MESSKNIIKICLAFLKILQENIDDREINWDTLYCKEDEEEILISFNYYTYGPCGDTDINKGHIWISPDEIIKKCEE